MTEKEFLRNKLDLNYDFDLVFSLILNLPISGLILYQLVSYFFDIQGSANFLIIFPFLGFFFLHLVMLYKIKFLETNLSIEENKRLIMKSLDMLKWDYSSYELEKTGCFSIYNPRGTSFLRALKIKVYPMENKIAFNFRYSDYVMRKFPLIFSPIKFRFEKKFLSIIKKNLHAQMEIQKD